LKNQWPIDFDALDIGSRITATKIEGFCGHKVTDPAYRYKGQLHLVNEIRHHRPDLNPYVRTQGYDVIVMDDTEAAQHQEGQGRQSLRRFLSSHVRNMGIDVGKLNKADQKEHERVLNRNGRFASAIVQVRKKLRLESYRSSKPKLHSKGKETDGEV